ncbi:MAG: FecR domain-containing protein [Bacteroidales bacterium]|nr:FecR domain-containing protein [Bacteroidales bacterium]
MIHSNNYTEKEWAEYASSLSGEVGKNKKFPGKENIILEKYWKATESGFNPEEIDVDSAWEKIISGITEANSTSIKKNNRSYLKIAAAITLILTLSAAVLYITRTSQSNYVVVSTGEKDAVKEISLPGGNRVWLNRNSTLSYKTKPDDNSKNIKLSGEGYFDIVHDPSHPFIIDAGKATIRVIGTTFNVITSNSKKEVEVFVESGNVLLSTVSGKDVVLEPGYIGRADNKSAIKILNNNKNYLAWKTGLLVYEDTPLNEVLHDLNRVYGINITVEDPSILDYRITSTFDKDPGETIINVICITFNLNYVKDNADYHLSRK